MRTRRELNAQWFIITWMGYINYILHTYCTRANSWIQTTLKYERQVWEGLFCYCFQRTLQTRIGSQLMECVAHLGTKICYVQLATPSSKVCCCYPKTDGLCERAEQRCSVVITEVVFIITWSSSFFRGTPLHFFSMNTDDWHSMSKSLIHCSPISNPNPR